MEYTIQMYTKSVNIVNNFVAVHNVTNEVYDDLFPKTM